MAASASPSSAAATSPWSTSRSPAATPVAVESSAHRARRASTSDVAPRSASRPSPVPSGSLTARSPARASHGAATATGAVTAREPRRRVRTLGAAAPAKEEVDPEERELEAFVERITTAQATISDLVLRLSEVEAQNHGLVEEKRLLQVYVRNLVAKQRASGRR
mmetsp:Transcript_33006/g.91870  ORF Transcript_33006/g.91870 Transcript_33006/m.91870 type:complete len:164 (-) Transcript_33006:132-623(-)